MWEANQMKKQLKFTCVVLCFMFLAIFASSSVISTSSAGTNAPIVKNINNVTDVQFSVENIVVDWHVVGDYISGFAVGSSVDYLLSRIHIPETNTFVVRDKNGALLSGEKTTCTGMTVQVNDSQTQVVVIYTGFIIGEVNGDGKINALDLLVLKKHILGNITLTDAYALAANATEDVQGTINAMDLLAFKQHLLGQTYMGPTPVPTVTPIPTVTPEPTATPNLDWMSELPARATTPRPITASQINTQASWDTFIASMRTAINKNKLTFNNVIPLSNASARTVYAHPAWIRDNVHMMKGTKYFDSSISSFIDTVLESQTEKGFFYEIITTATGPDSDHKNYVDETQWIFTPSNHLLIRLELEPDVDYLVVEGINAVWQSTQNDAWLQTQLPRAEKAINYLLTDEKRFDPEHGLVKRPFTIDSWDFAYGQPGSNRMIEPTTPMSIMHGDNSGVYQACMMIAKFYDYFGFGVTEKGNEWRAKAASIKANMDTYLWNGNFYMHQLHLGHNGNLGADEINRLSFSNVNAINRGVTTIEQSRKIIQTYMQRKELEEGYYFSEWYSLNPPYDQFTNWPHDWYINGAILPFVAGELATAAFNNGYEAYGWDILCRLKGMLEQYPPTDGMEFMYFWDGRTMKAGIGQGNYGAWGPAGWGGSAIITALYEDLYGIKDGFKGYEVLNFSPRWAITGINNYDVSQKESTSRIGIGYLSTNRRVKYNYNYNRTTNKMTYVVTSPSKTINGHILLPENTTCQEVRIDGEIVSFTPGDIYESNYVDFVYSNGTGTSFVNTIEVQLQ